MDSDLPLSAEDDEDDLAIARAVIESDADPRTVSHAAVRDWLLRVSKGDFGAAPPETR